MKLFVKFRMRGVGFYITAFAAILSLINVFVYYNSFISSYYFSWRVFLMPLLATVVFILLTVFRFTAPIASAVFSIFTFLALLLFFLYGYQYLADVSFGQKFGLETIGTMDSGYVFCVIAMLINLLLGVAGIFIKQVRTENNKTSDPAADAAMRNKRREK